jgi:dihydroorotase
MMLELAKKGNFTRELVIEKMCHNPAKIFNIEKRGFIRKGFYADLTLIDPNVHYKVEKSDLLYKCGWSPLEDATLSYKVTHTFVNGHLVYNQGAFDESNKGRLIDFAR